MRRVPCDSFSSCFIFSKTVSFFFFFFNDTATTEIYTLSLHDALPIYGKRRNLEAAVRRGESQRRRHRERAQGGSREDRKSTRLNSSHGYISYAVFCLKKKTTNQFPLFVLALPRLTSHAALPSRIRQSR